jgi:hypothetical protein
MSKVVFILPNLPSLVIINPGLKLFQVENFTLVSSGEDAKNTLVSSGEDVKTTLVSSVKISATTKIKNRGYPGC